MKCACRFMSIFLLALAINENHHYNFVITNKNCQKCSLMQLIIEK